MYYELYAKELFAELAVKIEISEFGLFNDYIILPIYSEIYTTYILIWINDMDKSYCQKWNGKLKISFIKILWKKKNK